MGVSPYVPLLIEDRVFQIELPAGDVVGAG
jgi:hypothetical protein